MPGAGRRIPSRDSLDISISLKVPKRKPGRSPCGALCPDPPGAWEPLAFLSVLQLNPEDIAEKQDPKSAPDPEQVPGLR